MSQRGRRLVRGGAAVAAANARKRAREEEDEVEQSEESEESEESSDYDSEDEPQHVQRRGGARGGRGGSNNTRGGRTTTTTTSQSSSSSASGSKKYTDVTTDELNKLIDEFVRYVLFVDRKKQALTRADIVAKVLPNHKDKKIITNVFARGKSKLRDIFGYEMVEIKKEKATGSEKEAPSSNTFLLKNVLPLALTNEISAIDPITSKEITLNYQQKSLLTVVLSIILLESGFIESDRLMVKLTRLGFESGRQHPVFGEWEKTLDRFVKELYLTRKKSEKDGASIFIYKFGPRALAETSKKRILRVIADVYGVEGELDPMLVKSIEMEDDDEDQQPDDEEEDQDIIPIVTQRSQQRSQQAPPPASQNNLRSNSQQVFSQSSQRGGPPQRPGARRW